MVLAMKLPLTYTGKPVAQLEWRECDVQHGLEMPVGYLNMMASKQLGM